MADILIKNGIVVTVDRARRVLDDGAVAIAGDRIAAVGPTAEVEREHGDAATVIDAARKVVLPGLVDAHAHAGHGLIKTMGGGRDNLWYEACATVYTVGSTEGFWRAEAQLAALERLRFGVTTGVSLLGGGDTVMRTDEPAYADAHCQGVVEVGTRSVVAIGPTRPPFPRRYARWEGRSRADLMVSFEQQMETCEAVIERWHGSHGRRINVCLIAPTLRAEHVAGKAAHLVDEVRAQTVAVAELARRHGLVFTQDGHGRGSVAYADELGILGPNALLSHSTELSAQEVEICRRTDSKIAHNPSAVASILGRCPAIELIDAGVTVALGSDATAPDRSGDMFRHMQQAMHYHRRFYRDPKVLPPGKALEMCTIDGAKALGMDDDVGSLEVGKKADVVLLDMRRPHLYPLNMPVYRAVYFANGNDVDTVIVDGRVLMRGRRVESVDEDAVLDAAQAETEAMLERTGLRALLEVPERFWRHTRY